jgi:hypothetical protein
LEKYINNYFILFGSSGWNINKTPSSWRYCMQNEKRTSINLSDLAFQEGIENGDVEILGTWSPSKISAITKSTVVVALWAPLK